MAKILVIDDNDTNRKLVVTLLNFQGHRTFEAVDGADGLASARAEQPDLVISDILMPTMDGYEFVRQLRADIKLSATAVILYTAHYHEREARKLAEACRVARVLTKPCATADLVQAVEDALRGSAARAIEPVAESFDRKHLHLITNKLSQKTGELEAANARLAALTDLNVQLASERDPRVLLEKVCYGARQLIGAKYAVLAVAAKSGADALIFSTSGIDFGSQAAARPRLDAGLLGRVVAERSAWRASNADGHPIDAGLPPTYPSACAFLAAPLMSLTQTFGWVCLADKIGGGAFSAEDERILSVLAAQSGRIYENGSLYLEIRQHAAQLQVEIDERERAATGLRASEERFRQLAENIQDVFFVISGDLTRTLYVSPAYEGIWGRSRSEMGERPLPWADSIAPDDRDRIRRESRWDTGGMAEKHEMEFRILRPDGEIRWIFARTFPVADENGDISLVVGVATDISQRKQSEAKIEHLNRVQSLMSGVNSLIVRVSDRPELLREACRLAIEHGRFRMAWCGWMDPGTRNVLPVAWAGDSADLAEAVRCTMGATPESDTLIPAAMRLQQPIVCNELEAGSVKVLFAREMLQRGYHAVVALPLVVESRSAGCLMLATDEREFFDEAEMRLLTELAGDISFALDHITKSERLNYLAYYDSLTGLANRTFFHERLSQYVSAAKRDERTFALVIADPERFNTINDTFGRHTGDELLRQLAERLVDCVGVANEVGRIGSDQFAALIWNVREIGDVARTVEEWWRKWLGTPFQIEGQEFRISARAGIALFPNDGEDAETLVTNAEAALQNAKETGNKHLFYTRHLSERVAETLALENQLRRALEREEFVLHYQPKVDLETRRVKGVEALIRWQSPERGLVAPGTFISLMEETGMIVEVGAWALRQASLDRSGWLERQLNAPRVAVNVSTVQLRREGFVRTVANVLKLAGREAGLDIEVTESLIMDDAVENIEKLKAIRELGVGIAIDDFGTGYSSLGYLSKLPAETLKIDRSFVSAMLDDPAAMTLVSSIISLAHALKLDVVAEGVESEEQAKVLRLLRCDQIQGYLISKPLPFDDMTAYLSRSQS
jgi:diguanylate cyclase (GGDEF)-like protein/PAS domain S-box-containing protein